MGNNISPNGPPSGTGQVNMSIEDLNTAKTTRCEKCNSAVWDQGFVIKETSPVSKVGQQVIQLPVIYCVMCGTPLKGSCPIEL